METQRDNKEVTRTLDEIADTLEILGENFFKMNAFGRESENIRSLKKRPGRGRIGKGQYPCQ